MYTENNLAILTLNHFQKILRWNIAYFKRSKKHRSDKAFTLFCLSLDKDLYYDLVTLNLNMVLFKPFFL